MFEKEIFEKLKEMHNSGKTYDEITRTTGIARTVVAQILGGQRPIKNPSVSMLLKVFPRAEIYLEGLPKDLHRNSEDSSVVIGDNALVANGIVRGDSITNIDTGKSKTSGIPADIRDAIISNTSMSAKEKADLLREIMNNG